MTLAVFNSSAFITASGLAIGNGATVEVRRESDSALAAIYSDAAGAAPITNPSAFADSSGRVTFYAAGIPGGYSIKVTKGAENWTLRNVAIGTAAQLDYPAIGANGRILMARSYDPALQTYVAALTKVLYGGTYAHNGTDAVNDWDIAATGAMDSTGVYWMDGAALTKRADAAWTVGNNGGLLDTGTVGNSDYYLWIIVRSDSGVVDYLCSLSATAPTMPANYNFKRLIGYFKRAAAANVALKTYETAGGGLELLWSTPTADINLVNTLTTTRRTDAVRVPLAFSVTAILVVCISDGAANAGAWVYCPDLSDVAPVALFNNIVVPSAAAAASQLMLVRTSAAGLIAARSSVATMDNYVVNTLGFVWDRRN